MYVVKVKVEKNSFDNLERRNEIQTRYFSTQEFHFFYFFFFFFFSNHQNYFSVAANPSTSLSSLLEACVRILRASLSLNTEEWQLKGVHSSVGKPRRACFSFTPFLPEDTSISSSTWPRTSVALRHPFPVHSTHSESRDTRLVCARKFHNGTPCSFRSRFISLKSRIHNS